MNYMILLYSDESQAPPTPTDAEGFAKMMEPWQKYTDELEKAGVLRGGDALELSSTATTVSALSGELVLTDGPFAETREQLGGYYLLECADLSEAIRWAGRCPIVHYGRAEVRPVMDLSGPATA